MELEEGEAVKTTEELFDELAKLSLTGSPTEFHLSGAKENFVRIVGEAQNKAEHTGAEKMQERIASEVASMILEVHDGDGAVVQKKLRALAVHIRNMKVLLPGR